MSTLGVGLFSLVLVTGLSRAIAQPQLTLSAQAEKTWFDVTIDRGPIRADSKSLRIVLDRASILPLVENEAQRKVSDRNSNFYLETRGFSSPTLVLNLHLENGGHTRQRFDLKSETELNIRVEQPIRDLDFSIEGTQEEFKCFNADTCVRTKAYQKGISDSWKTYPRVEEFDPLFSCNGVKVAKRIARPEVRRLTFQDDGIRRYLETDLTFEGQSHSELLDFKSVVGTYLQSQEPYRVASVFSDGQTLKVFVDTKPFQSCRYQLKYGDSSGLTFLRAVKLGEFCPRDVDDGFLIESEVGVAEEISKNWFFTSCKTSDIEL